LDKDLERFVEECFKEDANCAEIVLLTVTRGWKMRSKLIPRVATPFGGGIGRQGGVCGALSGGVVAIGARYGRDVPKDLEARDKSYALTRELFRRFKEEFGGIDCYDLIQCDLLTPEGRTRQREIRREKCVKFVARTVETVLELGGERP